MYLKGKKRAYKDVNFFKALGEQMQLPVHIEPDLIQIDAMFWRKVNAIHTWFVKNVQGGNDNCEEYAVSNESLQELLNVINICLKDKRNAEVLLAPESGFFFGNTDIDDYYFESLEQTKQRLEVLLSPEMKGWDYYYRSSW